MKADAGLAMARVPLDEVGATAAAAESAGYDGIWAGEITHDPFVSLALAAEGTEHIELGTSIAVAFARNPMSVAYAARDLCELSRGRFVLGLGSQVRSHVEERFGMPWSRPAARMEEFVRAVRAIWACWDEQRALDFRGEFYEHTLMTPFFDPGPSEHGSPRIFLAAVGEHMTEVAGAVADGVMTHAFTTPRYLEEVTLPALRRGLERSGRDPDDVEVKAAVFLATGSDAAELERAVETQRRHVAFHGATGTYRRVLAVHGWEDLQPELRALARRGRWSEMPALVPDELLEHFVVSAPPEGVAAAVGDHAGGFADRIGLQLPLPLDSATTRAVVEEVRRLPVRAKI